MAMHGRTSYYLDTRPVLRSCDLHTHAHTCIIISIHNYVSIIMFLLAEATSAVHHSHAYFAIIDWYS